MTDERLIAAVAAIDAANALDPNTVVIGGTARPKEVGHAERMTAWIMRLDPNPTDAQLLAARAHHLRRWSMPRATFPDGRAGYLRWRGALNRRHAEDVATILVEAGFDHSTTERVQQIILKKGRESDAAVQTHEDALCLTFLELQASDLAARLGHTKMVDVVAKTLRKMSPEATALAMDLELDEAVRSALVAADASPHT